MAGKNTEFTERLKKLIKEELKMSINSFADKSGIGHSTLGNYFNKANYGRVPEWEQLVKIAKAANKSVDWLLTGTEPTFNITMKPEEKKSQLGEIKSLIEAMQQDISCIKNKMNVKRK
jgi:transcriptional regulator with XRE-family HTH domain